MHEDEPAAAIGYSADDRVAGNADLDRNSGEFDFAVIGKEDKIRHLEQPQKRRRPSRPYDLGRPLIGPDDIGALVDVGLKDFSLSFRRGDDDHGAELPVMDAPLVELGKMDGFANDHLI